MGRPPEDGEMHRIYDVDAQLRRAVPPRLERLMRARGATRAEVCRATGVSPSALSRILSGGRAVSTDILVRLCVYLDADPAWLLGMSVWHVVPPAGAAPKGAPGAGGVELRG